jgi:hypothetical protein
MTALLASITALLASITALLASMAALLACSTCDAYSLLCGRRCLVTLWQSPSDSPPVVFPYMLHVSSDTCLVHVSSQALSEGLCETLTKASLCETLTKASLCETLTKASLRETLTKASLCGHSHCSMALSRTYILVGVLACIRVRVLACEAL